MKGDGDASVSHRLLLLIVLQSTVAERSELQAAETKEAASGHQSWLTGKSIGVICLTD